MRPEWPFRGRDDELARASSWLARGHGVLVSGVVGIGKTALARQLAARSAAAGEAVEWIAGRAARTVFPLEAFAPVLTERSSPLSAQAAARTIGRSAGPPAPAGRWVLVVDDAHLLDQASADVLLHLATAGTALVVATVRDGEPAPEAVRRLWMDGACERLDLSGLTPPAVHMILEEAVGGQLDQHSSAVLRRAAGGNLLFLRELLRAAMDEGLLTCEQDVWQLRGEPVLGRSLRELIEERMAGLAGPSRAAAELVAAGEPLPAGVAMAMAGEAPIDDLVRAGLVAASSDIGGPVVAMAHPLYGAVLREGLTPLRSRRIHLELARALDQWAGGTGQEQPGALVRAALWRLEEGEVCDPGTLLRAARAARTFSLTTAERLARAAVAARSSIDATLLLAEILTHQGQPAEAAALTGALPSDQLSGQDREAIVYCQVMGRDLGGGDPAGGLAALGSAQDLLADSPRLRAMHALLLLLDGRPAESVAVGGPLVADDAAPPEVRIMAATAVCPALLGQGRYEACLRAHASAAPAAAAVSGTLPFAVGALTAAASLAHLENGSLGRAEGLALAAHERAVADGDAMTRVRCTQALGRIALARGQLTAARRWLRETVVVLSEFDRVFLGWNLSLLARAAAAAGAVAEAGKALQDAAAAPRMGLFEAEGELALAAVSAASGKLGDAAETAAWAAELAAARGQWALALIAGHDAARWGGAAAAASVVANAAARVDGPLAACLADHTAALAAGDPVRLAGVSGRFERLGVLLHAAEAAAAAAGAYLRAGRPRQSAAAVARAGALLARCDSPATPWLAGITSQVPLTSREREVAVHAAAGRSDLAIARAMHISPRTVQTHLARAYAKLGIHGRQSLPQALSVPGAAGQEDAGAGGGPLAEGQPAR